MSTIKILALGDVVGPSAVKYLEENLRGKIRELEADVTVINAENAAIGNGLDADSARALLGAGADVLTSGNHIYRHSTLHHFLEDSKKLIRPINYPSECPGNGYTILKLGGVRLLVMNVLGTVYGEPLACPFESVERVLKRESGGYDVAILDIHAETTSEKAAIARCFDGRISAVWGTHTHVQTADARILPRGTGFITDLGMCGADDSILGIEPRNIITKLKTHMPQKFNVATGSITATGALFTIDISNGKALSVEAIKF
ncbi:MAG: YmdB family metallophosphoesterase [Clostridia bacterium]|nr:YmdB family metallophosphoesterase [Clostridia bacterium]